MPEGEPRIVTRGPMTLGGVTLFGSPEITDLANYLNKKRSEAAQRGLSPNYLRRLFIEMHLKTVD